MWRFIFDLVIGMDVFSWFSIDNMQAYPSLWLAYNTPIDIRYSQ